jgi:hypothetical protein
VFHQSQHRHIFDFKLTLDEIDAINELNKDLCLGLNPENFEFFMSLLIKFISKG